jgi:hypothetical protein
LNRISFRLISFFKYVYLVVFFALLAGFFHPLITNTNYDNNVIFFFALLAGFFHVIVGILVLFLGLVGGILLYKTTTSEKKKGIYLTSGFILIIISLYYIFQLSV